MDAVLHAQPFPAPPRSAPARPGGRLAGPARRDRVARSRSGRPRLAVVAGGRCLATTWTVPRVVLAVGVALAVAVVAVRLTQGTPPTTSWDELTRASAADAAPVAAPGDQVITVAPGDTLWGIARRLAPDRDPRPVVDALARANGGTWLQSGQDLVIPADLLAG